MRIFATFGILMFGLLGQAEAATYKLSYQGDPIAHYSGPTDFGRLFYPAFEGEIVLDEAAYGESFAGNTVTFFGINSPSDPSNLTNGIVSWSMNFPLYAVGGSSISFTFGLDMSVASWYLDALDGPPDYTMSPAYDVVYGGNGGRYRVAAKTWSVAAVPLPGAAGLLAVSLAGLGAVRRRRHFHTSRPFS